MNVFIGTHTLRTECTSYCTIAALADASRFLNRFTGLFHWTEFHDSRAIRKCRRRLAVSVAEIASPYRITVCVYYYVHYYVIHSMRSSLIHSSGAQPVDSCVGAVPASVRDPLPFLGEILSH